MSWLADKRLKSVLLPNVLNDDDDEDTGVLPESISITRIDDLLSQMRFHEVPKRAIFSIPFQLADGFAIGIKGLVSHFPSSLIDFDALTTVTGSSPNRRKAHTSTSLISVTGWK